MDAENIYLSMGTVLVMKKTRIRNNNFYGKTNSLVCCIRLFPCVRLFPSHRCRKCISVNGYCVGNEEDKNKGQIICMEEHNSLVYCMRLFPCLET